MLLDRRNHGYQGSNTDKKWHGDQTGRMLRTGEACQILLLPRLKYYAKLNEITLKGDTQKVQIDK